MTAFVVYVVAIVVSLFLGWYVRGIFERPRPWDAFWAECHGYAKMEPGKPAADSFSVVSGRRSPAEKTWRVVKPSITWRGRATKARAKS